MIDGKRLDGKVAIVTGGASGIGRATCLSLATLGSSVIVVDRQEVGITAVVSDIKHRGGEGVGLALDVRKEGDMEEMALRTFERYGRIDVLVACAGILRGGSPKTVAEMPIAEWDLVVETNLKGVFLSNRAVLSTMVKQGNGVIVNISSTSGRQGLAYDSAYCASKFGVIGFSEALAEEMRPRGVKVHVVLPGAVDTPMWDQNGPIFRPPDSLPPERVADLIIYMVTLPADTVLLSPSIVPFRKPHRAQKT
jgi:3-oxoacyl-[acyl-carrier protein] reductase